MSLKPTDIRNIARLARLALKEDEIQEYQHGLGSILGGLLRGQAAGAGGTTPGAGGLGSMLDMNGDGNPLDDILRMAGTAMR